MNLNFCQKCDEITIKGVTGNVKLGAVVETEKDEIYYVEGLNDWGNNVGKKIIISGCLSKIKHVDKKKNDNQIIQTVDNGIWIEKLIRKPKWKFTDK